MKKFFGWLFIALGAFLMIASVLLLNGCSTGDSWPETLYLDRLFVNGEEITASAAPAGPWSYITKETDEIVNNSVSWQNDDELSIELTSGKTYSIKFLVYTKGIADIRARLSLSGNNAEQNIFGYYVYRPVGGGSQVISALAEIATTTTEFYVDTANSLNYNYGFMLDLMVYAKADKTLTLQWAQYTQQVDDTTVKAGSFIEWRELE